MEFLAVPTRLSVDSSVAREKRSAKPMKRLVCCVWCGLGAVGARRGFLVLSILLSCALACGVSSQAADDPAVLPTDDFWTALPLAPDAREVYVSSSLGNDQWSGLSPNTPVRTLARGYQLLRDHFPDRMLLRRGDVWVGESLGTWEKSGRSPVYPMVIESYGVNSERPLILPDNGIGFQTKVAVPTRHIAIVGIALRPLDPLAPDNTVGLRWLSSGGGFLLEDCYVELFKDNITIQDVPGNGLTDVRLRRCIVVDSFSTSSHSQGLFATDVDGLVLEECVFDHNGWNEDVPGAEPTDFNHNVYIQSTCGPATIIRCSILNGSAAGIQARSGGVVKDNLLYGNPVALRYGGGDDPKPGGVSGAVVDNVFLHSDDIDDQNPRGHGVTAQNVAMANFHRNIFSHDGSDQPYGHAILFEGDRPDEVGVHNVMAIDNIVYNWRGGFRYQGDPGSELSNFLVANNAIQIFREDNWLLRHEQPIGSNFVTYSGNLYHKEDPDTNEWFIVNNQPVTYPQWVVMSEEFDGDAYIVPYIDPDRTLEEYKDYIGDDDPRSVFEILRAQSREDWDVRYGAGRLNEFIREGFQVLMFPY